MKSAFLFLLPSLVSCAAVPSASPSPETAAGRGNRLSLYLGQRSLGEDDWAPVEDQATLGVEFSQERPGSAIGWEVGLMGSSDKDDVAGVDVKASTGELYAGVRKTLAEGRVRPYVGGGLSFIDLKADLSGFGDEDDASLAAYAHGGVTYDISETLLIGLDLRVLFGSGMEIDGFDTDADYGQLALFIGVAL